MLDRTLEKRLLRSMARPRQMFDLMRSIYTTFTKQINDIGGGQLTMSRLSSQAYEHW